MFVGGNLLVFVSIACSCLLVLLISVRSLVFVGGNLLVFAVSIACSCLLVLLVSVRSLVFVSIAH